MPKSKDDVRIVVLQRGWVMVGRFSQSGSRCALDGASVLRYWGTTRGLGELVDGPTEKTKLDPCGRVDFHELTVIASIKVKEEKWTKHLS